MINILADDDHYITGDDDNDQDEQAQKLKKVMRKVREVKLKPEREEMIKNEFDCVVVHEFGDEYHLSEEERKAKNKFYEAFKVFNKCKHKYRKLEEYVKAMREALKCLDFVADNNGIYDPEKFKKMFLKDKIYINGLRFPKFVGRERKRISWEFLSEFILSDEPAENINPKDDEYYSSEDYQDMETVLFDQKELDEILKPETEEEYKESELFFDRDEREQEGNVVFFLDRKENKKLIKEQPELLYQLKEIKKGNRSVENMSNMVYNLTADDIEKIAEYDKQRGFASSSDVPEFKGDLSNADDYRNYLLTLEEYEKTQFKVDYHGKLKTQEQIDELQLKQALEEHGWNLRNLYENKEKEAKLKRIQKKEKQREKELRRKLVKVQERRKRRMGEDVSSSKKSKKNKNKKKSTKSKKESDKTEKKIIRQYQKEAEESIDEILLGVADRTDSFKEYKSETLDWSWDSVMEGSK